MIPSGKTPTLYPFDMNYCCCSMPPLREKNLLFIARWRHCGVLLNVVTDIPRQEQRGRRSAQSAIEFMINTFHVQDRSDFNECASASLISPAWSGITTWRKQRFILIMRFAAHLINLESGILPREISTKTL